MRLLFEKALLRVKRKIHDFGPTESVRCFISHVESDEASRRYAERIAHDLALADVRVPVTRTQGHSDHDRRALANADWIVLVGTEVYARRFEEATADPDDRGHAEANGIIERLQEKSRPGIVVFNLMSGGEQGLPDALHRAYELRRLTVCDMLDDEGYFFYMLRLILSMRGLDPRDDTLAPFYRRLRVNHIP